MPDIQKNTTYRWVTFNKVLLLMIVLVLFFGYMDHVSLQGVFSLDAQYQNDQGWSEDNNVWTIYWEQIQPMFWKLWAGIMLAIAGVWYLITKDKSEAAALFLTPYTAMYFGAQDLFYFLVSPQNMTVIGCWADAIPPIRVISNLLGETCPTTISFFLSAGIGILLAWIILYRLKYMEPTNKRRKK